MVRILRQEYYKDFAEFTRSFFAAEQSGMICTTLYGSMPACEEHLEYLEGFWQHICLIQSERITVQSGDSERLVSQIAESAGRGIRALSILGIPHLPDGPFSSLARGLNLRRERIRHDRVLVMFWLTPTRLPEFALQAPDLMSIARVYAISDDKYTISMDLVADQINRLEEQYAIRTNQFIERWAKGRLSELKMDEEDERRWLLLAEAVRDEVDAGK